MRRGGGVLPSHAAAATRVSPSAGIVHRDIKPDNLCVRADDHSRPLVIDVGISAVGSQEDPSFCIMFPGGPATLLGL